MESSVTKMLPNLFDILDHAAAGTSADSWWGPVVGSDEGQSDGAPTIFEMNLVQDETTDGVTSDVRLKSDIQKVGSTVYGLPLYHFRYTDRSEVFEGVMAQDVLDVMPSAVTQGADGFYRVKYDSLGIEMRRVA